MPTLQPERREAEREIDRGGRFADAALAGGDRDDRLDAGHALTLTRRAAPARAPARRRRPLAAAAPAPRRPCAPRSARPAPTARPAARAPPPRRARAPASQAFTCAGIDGDREEHLAVGRDHVRKRAGLGQRRALGRWMPWRHASTCSLVTAMPYVSAALSVIPGGTIGTARARSMQSPLTPRPGRRNHCRI